MYMLAYNLSAKPFSLVPDPDFFFLSKGHKKVLNYLKYAIIEGEGFAVVTGEVGAGKTTLLRTLLRDIKGERYNVAFIKNTMVEPHQMLRMIADDFGVPNIEAQEKDQVLRALNNFLIEEFTKNRRPVLIIDEAQNLSTELLEEVRLLSNLETDKYKLLQIVIAGQPELRAKLAMPHLRQLRQRVFMSYHLRPLNREETEDYIKHRMQIVGGEGIFLDEVFDEIFSFTGGVPRVINTMCSFLLLCGAAEESSSIGLELVLSVKEDIAKDPLYEGELITPVDSDCVVEG